MNLYHETPTLWQSLVRQIYPPIALDELQIFDASTQHHVTQIERRLEPAVDSTAGRAIPMMAILGAESGRWIADGTNVLLRDHEPDGTLNT
jgi:hypothetical protein